MTVLVAYASAHGSTRAVAERIASRLAEHGLEAECLSVDQVKRPTSMLRRAASPAPSRPTGWR